MQSGSFLQPRQCGSSAGLKVSHRIHSGNSGMLSSVSSRSSMLPTTSSSSPKETQHFVISPRGPMEKEWAHTAVQSDAPLG